ncbi:MAG: amidohydrolase family protein, partial [Clostridia bacterium]|nr:amidohydrolase family protein [Clostridia bacterium]
MYNLLVNDYDRYVYETELKNFLPQKFIDFHTHINLASFNAYGSHNGGSTWTDLIADELPAEDLMRTYRELFPCQEVTPLVFGGCLTELDQTNRYVYDMRQKYGFPTLYRSDYAMPADKLEEDVKKGGFLGLKPYLTNCPSYIPSKETRIFDFLPHEHLQAADKNGWIVMLHIPRDGRLRDPVNLAQLLEIEEKYPGLKLVVAHIGRAYSAEDIGNAF